MTLKEMSADYQAQAEAILDRLRVLRQARERSGCPGEQALLDLRMRPLQILYREAREQADLLEHYYDRGYYRDERYTL